MRTKRINHPIALINHHMPKKMKNKERVKTVRKIYSTHGLWYGTTLQQKCRQSTFRPEKVRVIVPHESSDFIRCSGVRHCTSMVWFKTDEADRC
jgi:hypothetical protein